MRPTSVLLACVLLLPLLTGPGLGLTQGNGFRWFWRGSTGGSTTHKFSFQSRGGSTTGSHSMVVVRVKDSAGRTVMLDSANPQVSRSIVHGFSGKGANKSTFTVTKTIGGISSARDVAVTKPSKHMQPPPPPSKPASPSIVKKIVPTTWIVPPAAEAATPTKQPANGYLPPATTAAPKQAVSYLSPQVSSKLILGRLPPASAKSQASYSPSTPAAADRAPLRNFIQPPSQGIVDVTGPSAPAHGAGPSGSGHASGPSGSGRVSGPSGSGHASGPSGTGHVSGPSGSGHLSGPSGSGHVSGPSGSGHLSGPSAPAPTPTPASHVGRDIRRNLSGRVDGSVFFGILPVVNDLQRPQEMKTEPPPKVVISRRPGKCPYVNMTRCPAALAGGRRSRCSNDSQCASDERCCYNPCAASSMCMRAVL